MSSKTLVTVRGFAPAGLVARLQQATWASGRNSDGAFENFDAIGLGGYCLARPADNLARCHFVVVVTEGKMGEYFEVDGFGFPSIPAAMREGPPVFKKNKIFKHMLRKRSKGLVEYTLELRAV